MFLFYSKYFIYYFNNSPVRNKFRVTNNNGKGVETSHKYLVWKS